MPNEPPDPFPADDAALAEPAPPPALLPPARSPTARDRLAALFEVILCSGYPTQLFLAQALVLAGLAPKLPDGRLSPAYVFTLTLADTALLVFLVVWLLRMGGESARTVLFGRRPILREVALGVALVPLVFALVGGVLGAILHFLPRLHNVPVNPLEGVIRTRLDAWLFAIVAVVGGGVREEVQRAFVLHRFERYLGGAALGLVLFSLVFGSGHVIQGWDVAVTTTALGLFWGAIYLLRRSVLAPGLSHAIFNTSEIIRYTLYGP